MLPVPPTECVRARESVSAQLDGELSELETTRLDVHLRECPACAAWAREVRLTTTRLRHARLEVPTVSAALPGRQPRRRTGTLALATAAAAMAAAAAIGVIGALTPSAQIDTSGVAALRVGPTLRQQVLDAHILTLDGPFVSVGTLRSGNLYAA